jgi:hypothetical protein
MAVSTGASGATWAAYVFGFSRGRSLLPGQPNDLENRANGLWESGECRIAYGEVQTGGGVKIMINAAAVVGIFGAASTAWALDATTAGPTVPRSMFVEEAPGDPACGRHRGFCKTCAPRAISVATANFDPGPVYELGYAVLLQVRTPHSANLGLHDQK